MTVFAAAIATLVATGTLQGGQQAPPAIEVVAKRFLRADATLVDGFCRVPFGFLTLPSEAGAAREGVYRVDVVVRDSLGMLLHESGWSQSVAGDFLTIPGASTVEHFALSVAEGQYTVSVTVTDSISGSVRESTLDLRSLDGARISDLLLSSEMRRASDETATAGPGEVQKGNIFLSSSPVPTITPRQPDLYYYLEMYPGEDVSVELTARVMGEAAVPITSTAPERLDLAAAGGVAARSLSLAGLPEGDYRLEVTARFPDGDLVRDADFHMAGFETEAQIAEVVTGRTAADPFTELTEARLDSLYAPLVYVQDQDEKGVYEGLSLQGKRNYLREFWAKRDPTPETPANEYRAAYYSWFAEANRRFHEGGAGAIPGWRTDRGRIYLKRGVPEEVLQRPSQGETPPYEVWKYTRPRMLKYVFLDESGLGHFALIYTDDRFETSRGDWEALLGPYALEDVLRF